MSAFDSSVPWQPCTRADWPAVPVKFMFETVLGKMLQPQPSSEEDVEAPYIKSLHVQWHGVTFEDLPTMWASPTEIAQLELNAGDLMVCEGGEVGRGALVLSDPPLGWAGSRMKCNTQDLVGCAHGKTLQPVDDGRA